MYDNLAQMEEGRVGSGLYWNYFYHSWKIISSSPFANAVAFVDNTAVSGEPESFVATITDKSVNDTATVLTVTPPSSVALRNQGYGFVQTADATENGIAIHKYGAIIIPTKDPALSTTLEIVLNGVTYTAGTAVSGESDVGDTITFTKE